MAVKIHIPVYKSINRATTWWTQKPSPHQKCKNKILKLHEPRNRLVNINAKNNSKWTQQLWEIEIKKCIYYTQSKTLKRTSHTQKVKSTNNISTSFTLRIQNFGIMFVVAICKLCKFFELLPLEITELLPFLGYFLRSLNGLEQIGNRLGYRLAQRCFLDPWVL